MHLPTLHGCNDREPTGLQDTECFLQQRGSAQNGTLVTRLFVLAYQPRCEILPAINGDKGQNYAPNVAAFVLRCNSPPYPR